MTHEILSTGHCTSQVFTVRQKGVKEKVGPASGQLVLLEGSDEK
jgi:hypothetical protein